MPLCSHRWVKKIDDPKKTQKHVQEMLEELLKPLAKREENVTLLALADEPPSASSTEATSSSFGSSNSTRQAVGSSSSRSATANGSVLDPSKLLEEEGGEEDLLDVTGLWCNTLSEEAKLLISKEPDNSDPGGEEELPTIQELKQRVKKKLEDLHNARITYSGREEIDEERSVFISKMRYTYTSIKTPRCGKLTRGTDAKVLLPVLQLATFERLIVRYTKQRKRDANGNQRRDITDFVPSNRKFWKVNAEYEIPLSYTLHELCDILMAEVASQNDFAKLDKRLCTAAFCIDGQIYKDDRTKTELGVELQEYMKKAMATYRGILKIPQYADPPLLMSRTRLCDIKVHLGEPFVFVHERENPQILLFTDLRFSSAPISEYPMTLLRRKVNLKKCEVCGGNYARKLTLSTAFGPSEYTSWCQACFDDFHFDANGELLAQGPEFRYYDY